MFQTHAPVLEALRRRGADPVTLAAAVTSADETGRPLHDVLVDDGIVTELELAAALAEAYGIGSVDLASYPVDAAAISAIPSAMTKRHRVLGIAIDVDSIVVATADPGDVLALDDVRAATGLAVTPVVVARDELVKALDHIARSESDLDDMAATLSAEPSPSFTNTLDTAGEEAPIVRYVNGLIERAIDSRASDIHIEPTEDDLRVRLRIDGVLHETDTVPRAVQSALISRLKIMSGVDITERRVPQNGRITVELNGRDVDLRTATLPTVWGEKLVLRVLDTGGVDLELKRLGFTDDNYARFSTSFAKPHGMLLVTGPTGSGKTTTLYAALSRLNASTTNILTVEDPIEYELAGVGQTQVNARIEMTFAKALRAILRQDPDVIMIGEIRDLETAQIAVQASLTGHLVLATLHTNDSAAAVTRLLDMGIEPFLLSSSLLGAVAQRLVRKLCPVCKRYDEHGKQWHAVGCDKCGHTGYQGRVGIYELLLTTDEIRAQIHDRASEADIRATAQRNGMRTMREDGERWLADGTTTQAELLRVTKD